MASIHRLKVDQVLWSVEKERSSLGKKALFPVRIKEINLDEGWVVASWNSNPPCRFYGNSINKWRVNKPQPKRTVMGLPSY